MSNAMDRKQVINAILEYYNFSWKQADAEELKLELQSIYRHGFKGLKNWTDEELATEIKRPACNLKERQEEYFKG